MTWRSLSARLYCHVIIPNFDHHLLCYLVPHDVASVICKAIDGGQAPRVWGDGGGPVRAADRPVVHSRDGAVLGQ